MRTDGELLIVEDNPGDYAHYVRMLDSTKHNFTDFRYINDLSQALEHLSQHTPRCCLLDYRFPGGSAKDLLQQLQTRLGHLEFPVVIITGQGNERLAVELMQLGAQDYLVKDKINGPELLRALKNAMRTFDLQEELRQLAQFDPLTGLINRSLFIDRMEQAVQEAQRYGRDLSLIYLDIDFFKQTNDDYGHNVGDQVLRQYAARIKHSIRTSDSVSRLGGDEFVILLLQSTIDDAETIAEKLMECLPAPIEVEGVRINLYPSMGIANFPNTANNHQELLQQADTALYHAKEAGRGQYCKFSGAEYHQWQRRHQLALALPEALRLNQLMLAYQPINDTETGQCHNVEALVRWQFSGEWIPSKEIIELIQQGPLLIPFHEWLFNTAFSQLKQWQTATPDLQLSLNMPGAACQSPIIREKFQQALEKHQVSAESVILEITANFLARRPGTITQALRQYAALGTNIAIDDFGSGSGFLDYLTDLPSVQLKISRQFLLEPDPDGKHAKIVRAVTALGHSLGLKVTAKGIETVELMEQIRQLGCDNAQGFLCGHPAPGHPQWEKFLADTQYG